jgi:hypothetical protein
MLIFIASQEEEVGIMDKEFAMDGTCKAEISIRESPSKVKFLSSKLAARRVARALLKLGSKGRLI